MAKRGDLIWRVVTVVVLLLILILVGLDLRERRGASAPEAEPVRRQTATQPVPAGPSLAEKQRLAEKAPIYEVLEPRGGSFYRDDPTLGLTTTPNLRAHAWKRAADILVFDVIYQTDRFGLRKQPSAGPIAGRNILLLGGGATFGEGVNDEQTFASILEQSSKGSFKGFNIGCNAWGPQHTLRWLEESREAPLLQGRRATHAVYLATPSDLARTSGRDPVKGPRYTLGQTGALKYAGSGEAPRTDGGVDPKAELALFVAIMARTKRLFEQRQGGKLSVILWWRDEPVAPVSQALAAAGVPVATIEEVIPDYRSNQTQYELFDNHPSPAAHAAIARYLSSHLP